MPTSSFSDNVISADDIIIPVMGITGSGFDDSRNEMDDAHILNQIAGWLVLASRQTPPLKLSGIIYLHPINEAGGRMRGSARNNLNMFRAMCGEEPMSSVVVATTMWGKINEQNGTDLQKQLSERYWKSMIDAGTKVIRHDDNRDSALRIVEYIMSRKAQVKMDIQKQLEDGRIDVKDTSAGQQLRSKVLDEQSRARDKLKEAQADFEQALRESDNTAASELLDLQQKHETTIQAKDAELESMKKKADDLLQQTLDSLAAAENERARLQKESEESIAAIKKEIEATKAKQVQRYSPPPPSYSSQASSSQASLRPDPLMEMQLKMQERQNEMEQRRRDAEMQTYFHFASTAIAKEQLTQAQKGVKWGKTGAIVGTVAAGAAVLSCNVM
ncbi:hypothetical protein E8E11_007327 [Didymella keratinophila]|nr:hypothetical protein E8E11_007327 [Didymella keratinophila]